MRTGYCPFLNLNVLECWSAIKKYPKPVQGMLIHTGLQEKNKLRKKNKTRNILWVWGEKQLLPILFRRLRVVSTASIVFLKLSNSTTPSQHWICHLRSIQHTPYHAEPHLKGLLRVCWLIILLHRTVMPAVTSLCCINMTTTMHVSWHISNGSCLNKSHQTPKKSVLLHILHQVKPIWNQRSRRPWTAWK